jgi:hypothetical protein
MARYFKIVVQMMHIKPLAKVTYFNLVPMKNMEAMGNFLNQKQ